MKKELGKVGKYVFSYWLDSEDWEKIYANKKKRKQCKICGERVSPSEAVKHAQKHIIAERESTYKNKKHRLFGNDELKGELGQISFFELLEFYCKVFEDYLDEKEKDYVKDYEKKKEKCLREGKMFPECPEPYASKDLFRFLVLGLVKVKFPEKGSNFARFALGSQRTFYCPYCGYLWRMRSPHSGANPPSRCPNCHEETHPKIAWLARQKKPPPSSRGKPWRYKDLSKEELENLWNSELRELCEEKGFYCKDHNWLPKYKDDYRIDRSQTIEGILAAQVREKLTSEKCRKRSCIYYEYRDSYMILKGTGLMYCKWKKRYFKDMSKEELEKLIENCGGEFRT